ncbi:MULTISPECIES: autotransporter outer membrane beta-barrel domain-containing protein [unclassified Beijerinckia]|uniref:autotransporter outer membrane beta-barrel domain-containing protein n=1 Tax=unclassified Beijerinckia TaxID=2638183 RepID=UPI000894FC15|nr:MULTISPECIES: autotransporter outer membrane beta-barrel domain-containing protein [unclassified Beijerinckia]MDH7798594.1 outer membrane autotransporter protein [Beijerinckia sp. GAS462]SED26083.1 outer membrane autotransporter barrel domain-containing protein [Beijerinckia sp. 28-YEA-48]
MMRRTATDGAHAVSFRRFLFLTTAMVTLVTIAGMQPVCAQSVTGSGVNPGGIVSPNWSVGEDLQVGVPGGGTLNILGGGTVTNDTGMIGANALDQGTVTVSGHDASGNASTWTNNGDLVVGQDGRGTLSILDGGKVSNVDAYIGAGTGSQGDVTVSGRDVNGNASTWNSTGQINIGDNGAGTLLIQNGGVVNSALALIGIDSDGTGTGTGTVTVSGHDGNGHASTWNNTNQVYIGGGTGTLNILDGGVVNSGQAVIAYGTDSQGNVIVSGRDSNGNASTWNAANNIYVGFSGNGTLTIADGAAVDTRTQPGGGAASIYIGYFSGSQGTVNVSSTTGNVSSLTATDYIDVGSNGSGTMTVGKGGFVSAANDVYIGRFSTASGTLQLDGDASGRGVLETGSVIKGIGTTTILDLNGGILRANRNEANFLNGFTALTVSAGGAWFDTNGHDIGIGTNFSGSSNFNKLGLGQLTLTGDSSGFTGASTVSAGTLAVNGVLGGNMLVDTAGRLVGTGSVGHVVNTGVIAPGYGNAMGTLTIQGDYVSNGGRLEIATVLGDDNSQTSRLRITGSTSGVTQVSIINRGGIGAQTVEGIRIVEVAGASNGTFVLNGNYTFGGAPAVIAGAYVYRLYQGGVSTPTDGDWYLRSALNDPGTPSAPGGPAAMPLYQPGVPVYEAYGSNLQSLNTLPTLQQRVGNRIWGPGANGDGNGIWGRTEGARGRFSNAAVSTTGLDQSIDTWKMQVGADRVLVDSDTKGRLVASANVSYGEANSRLNSVFGDGGLKTNGYGLGATLTWYGVTGFYVDGQAQINRYSSNLNSKALGLLTHNNGGSGEAFSIEAGKRISLSQRFGITPQFQMVYSNVRFDRFVDPTGALVSSGNNNSFRTRWGIALDHQGSWDGGRSRIYGIANVSYEWLHGMRTLVAGTPIINAGERLWGELGLGASVTWHKALTFYGELSGSTPFRDFGTSYILKGNIGLRAQF